MGVVAISYMLIGGLDFSPGITTPVVKKIRGGDGKVILLKLIKKNTVVLTKLVAVPSQVV